jgi:hypothetical protein
VALSLLPDDCVVMSGRHTGTDRQSNLALRTVGKQGRMSLNSHCRQGAAVSVPRVICSRQGGKEGRPLFALAEVAQVAFAGGLGGPKRSCDGDEGQ